MGKIIKFEKKALEFTHKWELDVGKPCFLINEKEQRYLRGRVKTCEFKKTD